MSLKGILAIKLSNKTITGKKFMRILEEAISRNDESPGC